MTRFRRKSAALNPVRIIPVWHHARRAFYHRPTDNFIVKSRVFLSNIPAYFFPETQLTPIYEHLSMTGESGKVFSQSAQSIILFAIFENTSQVFKGETRRNNRTKKCNRRPLKFAGLQEINTARYEDKEVQCLSLKNGKQKPPAGGHIIVRKSRMRRASVPKSLPMHLLCVMHAGME